MKFSAITERSWTKAEKGVRTASRLSGVFTALGIIPLWLLGAPDAVIISVTIALAVSAIVHVISSQANAQALHYNEIAGEILRELKNGSAESRELLSLCRSSKFALRPGACLC